MTTTKKPKAAPKNYFPIIARAILLTIWVGLVIVAAQFLVAFPLHFILGDLAATPVATTLYAALSYTLAFVVILFVTPWLKFLGKSHVATRVELGLRGLPTWTDLGLGIVGYIVTMIVAVVACSLLSVFPWFNLEEAQDVGFNSYIVGFDRIVAFIALVIVAPIAEELIFRGWLYGKLRNLFHHKLPRRLGIGLAIFLVSLAFGVLHGQWNVGVIVFVMSIVMCILREFTGTIYAGILVHMLKNGIAFFMLYVFTGGIGF